MTITRISRTYSTGREGRKQKVAALVTGSKIKPETSQGRDEGLIEREGYGRRRFDPEEEPGAAPHEIKLRAGLWSPEA